jgi:hypothetical protein
MLAALPLVLGAPPVLAQGDEAEAATRAAELEAHARVLEAEQAEHEKALREAEAQLAEAAARVAELSTRNLPEMIRMEERIVEMRGKPRIGVMIAGEEDSDGPVEGVRVIGVTPGSAAADAGLRSGDILTAVDDESLSAPSRMAANQRLLERVRSLDEGDKLDIEYLRDGNVGKVTVEPRPADEQVFVFKGGPGPDIGKRLQIMPGAIEDSINAFAFRWSGRGWGDMELVELNEGLGKYFGTTEGLLVVKAPGSDTLMLEEGDVIQSIDGREPQSVEHAIRILSSYQPGEKLELVIMRDKRRRTLEVEIPDDRMSFRGPLPPLGPPGPKPVHGGLRTVIVETDT